MRGDRPRLRELESEGNRFTPHARGSTVQMDKAGIKLPVYPACAGIDPCGAWRGVSELGLPRMRGDRPCFDERIAQYG